MGINSPEEMKKLLDRDLLSFISTLSEKIRSELVERTKGSVYANEPSTYRRTYDFLHSIDNNTSYNVNSSEYRSSVFFNPLKMNKGKGQYRYKNKLYGYGKHRDAYGNDVRESLIGWLEDGHVASRPYAISANSYGRSADEANVVGLHSYPAYDGGHMLRDTGSWLSSEIPNTLLKTFGGIDNKNLYIER